MTAIYFITQSTNSLKEGVTDFYYHVKIFLKSLIGWHANITNLFSYTVFSLYLIILILLFILFFFKLWLFYYKIKIFKIYNKFNNFIFSFRNFDIILDVHLIYNILCNEKIQIKNTIIDKSPIKDLRNLLLLKIIIKLCQIILRTFIWLFIFFYINNLILNIIIFVFILFWLNMVTNYMILFFYILKRYKQKKIKAWYFFLTCKNITFSNRTLLNLITIFNCNTALKIWIFFICYAKLIKLITLFI